MKEIKLIELGSGFDLGGKIEGVSRKTLGFWPIQLDGVGAVHCDRETLEGVRKHVWF